MASPLAKQARLEDDTLFAAFEALAHAA